jgi:hypothetical protein
MRCSTSFLSEQDTVMSEHLSDEIRAYFAELGRFMHDFAAIEVTLQGVLAITVDTPHETSRAVFSGVRIDQAQSFLRRLAESRGEPLSQYLVRAFPQLKAITATRNNIAHFGARFDGPEIVVSNQIISMPGKEVVTPVSGEILIDMRIDLNTIHYCLMAHLWHRSNAETPPFENLALEPWRYKLPQQNQHRQPRADSREKDS